MKGNLSCLMGLLDQNSVTTERHYSDYLYSQQSNTVGFLHSLSAGQHQTSVKEQTCPTSEKVGSNLLP
jgi:hypothetical protein